MTSITTLYQKFLTCTNGVTTDTRKITPQSLFFALKGANFDGNVFAQEALQKGASFVVIDNPTYQIDDRCLLVADTLKALQDLAKYHRQQQSIPFIAITGTNGKTTTKELVRNVLAKKYKVWATEGNLNNHIGVPLTLLNMPKDTEIAVIEMGANKVGDITELVEIALPTHGLITNVGYAHLEGFGSFEGVFRTKTELYAHLLANKGTVIVNANDELLANAVTRRFPKEQSILFGRADSFYQAIFVEASPYIIYKDEKNHIVQTQLLGAYNFPNILAALTVGKLFGVDSHLTHEAIAAYAPTNNRSQVLQRPHYQIIMDAYNANPSSMRAALENLHHIQTSYKIAILGDMFELGTESITKHRELLDIARELSIDQLLVCGKDFLQARKNNDTALFFENKESLKNWLQTNPIQKGVVLLKGSRGMGLETLLEVL